MGEEKVTNLVYPRVLTKIEHNRMEEVIRKGVSTFLPTVDQALIDYGLLERNLDKVYPCSNPPILSDLIKVNHNRKEVYCTEKHSYMKRKDDTTNECLWNSYRPMVCMCNGW